MWPFSRCLLSKSSEKQNNKKYSQWIVYVKGINCLMNQKFVFYKVKVPHF